MRERIEGHAVMVAAGGQAAVAEVTRWRPGLVILDLMLPELVIDAGLP